MIPWNGWVVEAAARISCRHRAEPAPVSEDALHVSPPGSAAGQPPSRREFPVFSSDKIWGSPSWNSIKHLWQFMMFQLLSYIKRSTKVIGRYVKDINIIILMKQKFVVVNKMFNLWYLNTIYLQLPWPCALPKFQMCRV